MQQSVSLSVSIMRWTALCLPACLANWLKEQPSYSGQSVGVWGMPALEASAKGKTGLSCREIKTGSAFAASLPDIFPWGTVCFSEASQTDAGAHSLSSILLCESCAVYLLFKLHHTTWTDCCHDTSPEFPVCECYKILSSDFVAGEPSTSWICFSNQPPCIVLHFFYRHLKIPASINIAPALK